MFYYFVTDAGASDSEENSSDLFHKKIKKSTGKEWDP